MSQHDRPALFCPLGAQETQEILAGLDQRFGILPEAITKRYVLHRPNAKQVLLVNRDTTPPERPAPTCVGMPFMSVNMQFPKLTTAATMLLGREATRHVVALDQAQCARYLSRQSVELWPSQLIQCHSKGYVIVTFEGHPLGQGFYTPGTEEGPAWLASLYPKASANREDRQVF